ncbi:MAG TPA: ZIP family metal transporter [Vicinamibacteria bacterium]|nr:ZIP family metal transporter [Vicinamibacteria bacterium]
MLAAATLGLLSEAVHDVRQDDVLDVTRLGLVVFGFVVGVAIAAIMDRFIPHHHAGGHHQHLGHAPGHDRHDRDDDHVQEARRGYAVVGALTLHRIPEGLAIGAGFAVPGSSHLGLLLAIAVGVQNVCEGLVMAAPLRAGGVSGRNGFVIVATTGLVIPAAAVVGGALAGLAASAMPFILALAGGTLIYITSNEIIPESHSHGHEGTASAGVVLGFLLTMVLQAILH